MSPEKGATCVLTCCAASSSWPSSSITSAGRHPFILLTGGNRFYTSAAEGFIIASGLVTGLVYQRLMARYRPRLLAEAAADPRPAIYLLTVGITLVFLPVSEVLGLPWAQGLSLSDPVHLVLSILTLHRTYYLVDVLVLYTLLFAVAPLAFVVLAGGRAWPVLLASWGLWGIWQIAGDSINVPWPIMGNYLFSFAAWQVLFFTALVIGYRHDRMPALGARASKVALLVFGALTLAMIVGFFVIDPPTSAMPGAVAIGSPIVRDVRLWLQNYIFSRADLRLGRIVVSAVSFTFLFLFVTHFWTPVRRLAGWLLLPFGRHALYAYTVNIFVVSCSAVLLMRLDVPFPARNG